MSPAHIISNLAAKYYAQRLSVKGVGAHREACLSGWWVNPGGCMLTAARNSKKRKEVADKSGSTCEIQLSTINYTHACVSL